MHSNPSVGTHLLLKFSSAFSRPTFRRWLVLMAGAMLTNGRRTVTNLLRTVQTLAPGHATSYHRVFSKRRWFPWKLARILAGAILERWIPQGPVFLAGDDTVDEHRGKKVFGKGCHRDAVRSSHSFTAYRWGHKWVVLAILVRFPFASRPWALPILVALYRPKEWNLKHGRRHKTTPDLMRQLLAVLIRWFPHRRFVFSGDGAYGTHALAGFAHSHRKQLVLVSRFYPDANLYAPPPSLTGKRKAGRPRVKGAKEPSPKEVVAVSGRTRLTVAWYGGQRRRVEVVSATSHWFKAGEGLVPVRWVFVHDLEGTHRDEYFFSTDTTMTTAQIVEAYASRWSIETTFQEMRAYLGLETTRGWSKHTVLRLAPSLFGLYSAVALLYSDLPKRYTLTGQVAWAGKRSTTFSDAIAAVRRWLWIEWVFEMSGQREAFEKLSRPFRSVVLYALAPAA